MAPIGGEAQGEHADFFGIGALEREADELVEQPVRIRLIDQDMRVTGEGLARWARASCAVQEVTPPPATSAAPRTASTHASLRLTRSRLKPRANGA